MRETTLKVSQETWTAQQKETRENHMKSFLENVNLYYTMQFTYLS